MTVPSGLTPKYNDKSIITRAEYNALVKLATGSKFFSTGIGDESSFGGYDYGDTPPKQAYLCHSVEEIPLYSVFCIQPIGTQFPQTRTNPVILTVEKANDNNQQIYLTNSESGGFGNYESSSYACNAEIMAGHKIYMVALYTGTGKISPRVGYPCGIKPNTFEIDGAYVGFHCMGIDTANKFVYVTIAPAGQRWLVKPLANIAKNGTLGDCVIWRGPAGTEATTNATFKYKACNRTGSTILGSKFAEMVAIDGKAYVVPWECETTSPSLFTGFGR